MRRDDLRRYDSVSMDDFRRNLSNSILIQLFDFWRDRLDTDGRMRRDRLDPGDIRSVLPYVFIVEPVPGGRQFRYRLVGTYIQSRIQRKIEGLTVEEVREGPIVAHLNNLFAAAAVTGVPAIGVTTLAGKNLPTAIYHRMVLPMSTRDGTVDQLLGGWVAEYDPLVPPERQTLNPQEHPISLTVMTPD